MMIMLLSRYDRFSVIVLVIGLIVFGSVWCSMMCVGFVFLSIVILMYDVFSCLIIVVCVICVICVIMIVYSVSIGIVYVCRKLCRLLIGLLYDSVDN